MRAWGQGERETEAEAEAGTGMGRKGKRILTTPGFLVLNVLFGFSHNLQA